MKMTPQADIRKQSAAQLEEWFIQRNHPKFRVKQVLEWLWKKSVGDFEHMTNLSQNLRKELAESFVIRPVQACDVQKSSDRTIKTAFRLHDGPVVEGVLIPTTSRMTACISSQAGCSLTCAFCATGKLKLLRNLDAGEIYDQVAFIRKQSEENYGIPLSNIVYMGMGEPLLNYKNVLESIGRITSPDGLGMSPQRITVSTAGIGKMIRKLGDDKVKFNLALSLHAADDEKRSKIMPINESNSLEELSAALLHFYRETGTRPTLEYILFHDFNDSLEDAAKLEQFVRSVPSKVNIIEYNPIGDGLFQRADEQRLQRFCSFLEQRGVIVNVRKSRGKDIDAACGQLANKNKGAKAEQKSDA
ncbi:MAG: 23S rRNA (adenine(2503)-C(2))-methyltransferase RlmN [Bacteroidia bacterium]|jgi:23S rRNA (adenine2503-C2)-methyltransferase